MSVRTRFAPSPTGFLHIGGARTALYNWLYAKRFGGQFILRVEDTDAERSTEDSITVILDGLKWLGLDWDEGPGVGGDFGPYHQSKRTEIYDRYLEKLDSSGHIYEDEGAIRFRVPDKDITVHDEVCGNVTVNLKEQGSRRYNQETKQEEEANPDIVIKRPNGGYIFHFVNVVDDAEMGITHVIRGEDHLSNTPKHLALFDALGVAPPSFAHIPLNLNPSGSKMSKRDQGALIHEYQESGFLPIGVDNYMALLGWSAKDDQELFTLDELQERFDLKGINKANSKFDFDKCKWINGEHLKQLPDDQLLETSLPFIRKAGIPDRDPRIAPALDLVRERAQLLSEIPEIIAPVFSEKIEFDPAALEKLNGREGVASHLEGMAKGFVAVSDWKADSINAAISEVASGFEVKMGALMMPARIAATGTLSGADLMPLLELIGREEVAQRMRELAAVLEG
ncbi:MAG: glutamate--tRNA ligase family protein [Verrucomicrobiota bacterium]